MMLAENPAPGVAPTPEDGDVDTLIRGIAIPPRPALLAEVQDEVAADDPDLARIAHLIGRDVALTAGVLRSVNSPFYALSRKASSPGEAIALLGLRQIAALVTGFALRQAMTGDRAQLTRFWDVSGKRSYALSHLAQGLRGVAPDAAQSFGLFCDVGIPLLMQRFPDYAATTLAAANHCGSRAFTEVEQAAHQTDHTLVGALMARSWGLPRQVCDAIRRHHDYDIFHDPAVGDGVQRLVAMGLVAELAIQRFARMNESVEWDKGGERALGVLLLTETDLADWIDTLLDGFAAGVS